MSSVNKKEIEKFSKMAAEWWDPSGKFKPLHKFNPIRIKYIKENIINSFKLKAKQKPLDKINILDIGCGGGLLSEPMTRLGANVTGIDASSKNINLDMKLLQYLRPLHELHLFDLIVALTSVVKVFVID